MRSGERKSARVGTSTKPWFRARRRTPFERGPDRKYERLTRRGNGGRRNTGEPLADQLTTAPDRDTSEGCRPRAQGDRVAGARNGSAANPTPATPTAPWIVHRVVPPTVSGPTRFYPQFVRDQTPSGAGTDFPMEDDDLIEQAQARVAAQMDCTVERALEVMRDTARATDVPIEQIAADVVAGRLTFD